MPAVVSQNDIRLQILINLDYYKHATGPQAVAALKLAQLWATQLPEEKRRDLENAHDVDLTGF